MYEKEMLLCFFFFGFSFSFLRLRLLGVGRRRNEMKTFSVFKSKDQRTDVLSGVSYEGARHVAG